MHHLAPLQGIPGSREAEAGGTFPAEGTTHSTRKGPEVGPMLLNHLGQQPWTAPRIARPWMVGAMHGESQDTLEASWNEKSQQVGQDHRPEALSWVRGSSCNPGQRLRRTSTTRTRFKAAPNPAPQHPTQLPGTLFPQLNLLHPPQGDTGQLKAGGDVSSQPHRPEVRQQAPDQRAAGPLQPHKEPPSSLELLGTQPGESWTRGRLAGQRPMAPSPLGCCFCQTHVGKQGEPREKSSRNLPMLNVPAGHPFRENVVPDNQARAP